ncbi:MAG: hypothetical protein H6R01_1047 [Burkholderiaceae bacterium]|nr:hypothetical protein [Burkholderiaceae bacterium]
MYATHGKRFDTYYTFIQGKRINLGHDRKEAGKALKALKTGEPAENSIEDMCRKFIKAQRVLLADGDKNALSKDTINEYETSLTKWVCPVFGHMNAREFKPTHAAQYLEKMREMGRPVRANREIAALGSAFNYGMRMGMVDMNPCHGVKRNTEKPRTRLPTIAEVNQLIQAAKAKGTQSYMIALIGVMVAVTGRRRAEILRLRVSDLKNEAGITVMDAKTKPGESERTYLVEWTDFLRQLVQEAISLPRKVGSLYVFSNRDGQPYTDQGFKGMWNRVMHDFEDAGGEWFTAHDLRALYVSEKTERGENPETHKSEATTRRVYDRRRVVKVKPMA